MEIRPGSSANSVVSSAHTSMRSVIGRIFSFCLSLKRLSFTLVFSSGAAPGFSLSGPLSGGSSSAFEVLLQAPKSVQKLLVDLWRSVDLTTFDTVSLKGLSAVLFVSFGAAWGRSPRGPLSGGSSAF